MSLRPGGTDRHGDAARRPRGSGDRRCRHGHPRRRHDPQLHPRLDGRAQHAGARRRGPLGRHRCSCALERGRLHRRRDRAHHPARAPALELRGRPHDPRSIRRPRRAHHTPDERPGHPAIADAELVARSARTDGVASASGSARWGGPAGQPPASVRVHRDRHHPKTRRPSSPIRSRRRTPSRRGTMIDDGESPRELPGSVQPPSQHPTAHRERRGFFAYRRTHPAVGPAFPLISERSRFAMFCVSHGSRDADRSSSKDLLIRESTTIFGGVGISPSGDGRSLFGLILRKTLTLYSPRPETTSFLVPAGRSRSATAITALRTQNWRPSCTTTAASPA